VTVAVFLVGYALLAYIGFEICRAEQRGEGVFNFNRREEKE
jgi:hypothetical protein